MLSKGRFIRDEEKAVGTSLVLFLSVMRQRKAGSLQVPALSYKNENCGGKKQNKQSVKPYSGNYSPYAS